MAEGLPPGQPQQQEQPPSLDLNRLMQMYEPKQLMMLGQALTSILKVKAAMQPKPDPREQAMQPGAMQQLAMLNLQKMKQAEMQQQQQQPQPQQPPGLPIPRG